MSSPAPSMRRDVASAYLAAGAKVVSWVVIAAIVFRSNRSDFAVFALARATVGLLNYTSLGVAPAIIHMIAAARPAAAQGAESPDDTADVAPPATAPEGGAVLSYAPDENFARMKELRPSQAPYSNGLVVALLTGVIGLAVTFLYAALFDRLHRVPTGSLGQARYFVTALGIGTVLRLMSDVPGAVLQANGQIARDNKYLIAAEAAWVFLAAALQSKTTGSPLEDVGAAYVAAGAFLLVGRVLAAAVHTRLYLPNLRLVSLTVTRRMLAFGSLVAVAQLADFLYAPTDYILINRLLSAAAVADYAPAVQIDSAMLLMVAALAGVVLPRTASAHARGDVASIRRYYVRGTLASVAILTAAAAVTIPLSPWIFQLWLGHRMPETQVILPLVLIHTVVGGSGAVGRSVLLGMGKVKPFTASVLIAGVANVVLSYVFVRYFGWGLRGIVLGTIIVVVARAGVWTPWYVMRTLKGEDDKVTR